MDIQGKSIIRKLYFLSFVALLALLPWSNQGSSYALIALVITGIFSSPWKEKTTQLKKYLLTLPFIAFYIVYLIGLLYTAHITEGIITIQQKLVLLLIPLIAVSSVPLSEIQRSQVTLAFVFSNVLLTAVCVALNLVLVSKGAPYPQINFDPYTFSRFLEIHGDAHPAWMQFSYAAFSNPFIPPVYFSVYLTFCILILFYTQADTTLKKVLKYGIMGWFSIVIILLSSRMGIIIFLSLTALNLFLYLRQEKFPWPAVAKAGAFLFVPCAFIFFSPVTYFRVIEEPTSTPMSLPNSPENWNSINLRLLEWRSSLEGIQDYGITGTGTGGTLDVLYSYYQEVELGSFNRHYNSHNQYLETYLEIGLAGFIFLVLCFAVPLLHAIKKNDRLLFSLVAIVVLACFSTCLLEKAKGLVFFTAFVSLFMFTKTKNGSEVQ